MFFDTANLKNQCGEIDWLLKMTISRKVTPNIDDTKHGLKDLALIHLKKSLSQMYMRTKYGAVKIANLG